MTGTTSWWVQAALQLAYQSPLWLLYVVGGVFAVVRMRRCRPAMTVALAGLFVLLGYEVAKSIVMGIWLANPRVTSELDRVLTLTGWLSRGLEVIGMALVIAAVFIGRPPPPDAAD